MPKPTPVPEKPTPVPEKMKVAFKIVDLIDELIVGEEQDENIWNLILKAFKELNVKSFRDDLLKLLGYDPKQVKNIEDIY